MPLRARYERGAMWLASTSVVDLRRLPSGLDHDLHLFSILLQPSTLSKTVTLQRGVCPSSQVCFFRREGVVFFLDAGCPWACPRRLALSPQVVLNQRIQQSHKLLSG